MSEKYANVNSMQARKYKDIGIKEKNTLVTLQEDNVQLLLREVFEQKIWQGPRISGKILKFKEVPALLKNEENLKTTIWTDGLMP